MLLRVIVVTPESSLSTEYYLLSFIYTIFYQFWLNSKLLPLTLIRFMFVKYTEYSPEETSAWISLASLGDENLNSYSLVQNLFEFFPPSFPPTGEFV